MVDPFFFFFSSNLCCCRQPVDCCLCFLLSGLLLAPSLAYLSFFPNSIFSCIPLFFVTPLSLLVSKYLLGCRVLAFHEFLGACSCLQRGFGYQRNVSGISAL